MFRFKIGRAVAALLAVIAPLLLISAPAQAIVGGRPATEPYSASASYQLSVNGRFQHDCGGTLILPDVLRINAHCVTVFPTSQTVDPSTIRIRIGSRELYRGGIVVGVREIHVHADWIWAANGPTVPVADVSELKLSAPVPLMPFVIPPRVANDPGAVTRILGFGSTKPSGEGPLPSVLQELDTQIVPPAFCAAGAISPGELCVADVNRHAGACYGDSGSAALQGGPHHWRLVGGASRETSLPCGSAPVIYTDDTYYREWLYGVALTGKVPPPSYQPLIHRRVPTAHLRKLWGLA
ncbi:MAG: hypothetical protein V7607_5418 [Solirubrobacteraceae bacterium]